MYTFAKWEELLGKTLTSVDVLGDKTIVIFSCSDGSHFKMFHVQDCCEDVYLEDVCGDLTDLLYSPVLMSEMVQGESLPAKDSYDESFTWTFIKMATNRGSVTFRWYGSSNGYYSETPNFTRIR